jgi:hypothetical protein
MNINLDVHIWMYIHMYLFTRYLFDMIINVKQQKVYYYMIMLSLQNTCYTVLRNKLKLMSM